MQEQRTEEFDGRITPDVRRRLRGRRLAFGLSYERLAEVLGVSWATLRKWELGECGRCSASRQGVLANFLKGCYDEQLLCQSLQSGKRIANPSLDASRRRMQRIEQLCRLGEQHPEAMAELESALTAGVAAALRKSLGLVAEKDEEPTPSDMKALE